MIQSRLILDAKYRVHRVLGLASLALVIAMVGTGVVVSANFAQETGRRGTFAADVGILVSFLPLYAVAVWAAMKGRFDVHKRLILVASICMTGPALGRALDVVGVSRMAAVLLFPLMVVALPLTYDRRTVGRLHRASFWAIAFTMLVFLGSLTAFVVIGGG